MGRPSRPTGRRGRGAAPARGARALALQVYALSELRAVPLPSRAALGAAPDTFPSRGKGKKERLLARDG